MLNFIIRFTRVVAEAPFKIPSRYPDSRRAIERSGTSFDIRRHAIITAGLADVRDKFSLEYLELLRTPVITLLHRFPAVQDDFCFLAVV